MNKTKATKEAGWSLENSYAKLPESFYSKIGPSPVPSPKLIILNQLLAEELGLDIQFLQSKEGVDVLAGNLIPEGTTPIAQAYAGHQFGHFTMLGDGRAVLLGEKADPNGHLMDIQLKGSGRTPYSRGGDGRAALGPMLREYIISEAMYGLGILTTRSLAVVSTGEAIYRETPLPGAILTRVASSHIRVGTFQYIASRGKPGEIQALADYTLQRHFSNYSDEENPYLFLLQEVIKRQATLIAKWQLVGFIHGVMNTDNMAISGETIDYGPCAFMDAYDPATVFSSIDVGGRYAYGKQPTIGLWNLTRFAESLLPLLNSDQDKAIKLAQDSLSSYNVLFQTSWVKGMRGKLGLFNEEENDEAFIVELLNLMAEDKMDFTNTFLDLTNLCYKDIGYPKSNSDFNEWIKKWKSRMGRQQQTSEASKKLMQENNPILIPRNQRVEDALETAVKEGSIVPLQDLLKALAKPYDHTRKLDGCYTRPTASNCPYQTYCGT